MSERIKINCQQPDFHKALRTLAGSVEMRVILSDDHLFVEFCPGDSTRYSFMFAADPETEYVHGISRMDTQRTAFYVPRHPGPQFFGTGNPTTDALLADILCWADGRKTSFYADARGFGDEFRAAVEQDTPKEADHGRIS